MIVAVISTADFFNFNFIGENILNRKVSLQKPTFNMDCFVSVRCLVSPQKDVTPYSAYCTESINLEYLTTSVNII